MSKIKIKDGKFVVEGNKKVIDQKNIHKEKMKAYLDSYYSSLKNIDNEINEIDDNDPDAKEKEEKLRARKSVIEKMTKAQEEKTK